MGGGDLQARFGQRVREERTRRGYSQEEFAHLAELDRTYLSGVERGTRNITLRVVAQIAEALDVPPIALVRGSDVEADAAAGYERLETSGQDACSDSCPDQPVEHAGRTAGVLVIARWTLGHNVVVEVEDVVGVVASFDLDEPVVVGAVGCADGVVCLVVAEVVEPASAPEVRL